MNANYLNNKIKICIVGSGEWGSKIYNAASIVNRFDVIGNINTSTSPSDKIKLLNDADLIYIAVPDFAQKEYVEFAVKNNKHCICESPFLQSADERLEIYNQINSRQYTKVFHINYPYFLDQDFARIASQAVKNKSKLKFIKIECSGNKYKDDPVKAKRMYSNQAINLIAGICGFLNVNRFDKFIIHDDFNGELSSADITFLFSWDYSEYPKLNFVSKTSDSSDEKTLIYDQYDQVIPLLLLMSQRIRNEIPEVLVGRPLPDYINIQEITSKLVVNSYLLESTAEHITDRFMEYNGEKIEENDVTNLFFNGGFANNKVITSFDKNVTA